MLEYLASKAFLAVRFANVCDNFLNIPLKKIFFGGEGVLLLVIMNVCCQAGDDHDAVNTSQEEKFAMIIKDYEAQCRVRRMI